jgi:hypothetical protein
VRSSPRMQAYLITGQKSTHGLRVYLVGKRDGTERFYSGFSEWNDYVLCLEERKEPLCFLIDWRVKIGWSSIPRVRRPQRTAHLLSGWDPLLCTATDMQVWSHMSTNVPLQQRIRVPFICIASQSVLQYLFQQPFWCLYLHAPLVV